MRSEATAVLPSPSGGGAGTALAAYTPQS
jgi:hypothetical protein